MGTNRLLFIRSLYIRIKIIIAHFGAVFKKKIDLISGKISHINNIIYEHQNLFYFAAFINSLKMFNVSYFTANQNKKTRQSSLSFFYPFQMKRKNLDVSIHSRRFLLQSYNQKNKKGE